MEFFELTDTGMDLDKQTCPIIIGVDQEKPRMVFENTEIG